MYRRQALEVLQAELPNFQNAPAANRAAVYREMQYWLTDPDLALIRHPIAIGLLPKDEQEAWRALWSNVRRLRDQTAATPK